MSEGDAAAALQEYQAGSAIFEEMSSHDALNADYVDFEMIRRRLNT